MRAEVLVVGLLALGGCAGAKLVVPDETLASVPLDDKKAVTQALAERVRAIGERGDSARIKLNASDELDLAKHQLHIAELSRDNAKLLKEIATRNSDGKAAEAATASIVTASEEITTAEARVEFRKRRLGWAKAMVDQTEAQVEACNAHYEAEKARLAQSRNLKPTPDFNVLAFESADHEKQKLFLDSRIYTEGRLKELEVAQHAYEARGGTTETK